MNKLIEELEADKYSPSSSTGTAMTYNRAINSCIDLVREHMEGHTLVPDEPTQAMFDAAKQYEDWFSTTTGEQRIGGIYLAMLAASAGEE